MSKISILVVEDEGLVAENLADKLEQLGYAVAGIAVQGQEAVEMALRLRPRLILMDIQLEGPMDGIQAAEAIRNRYDVPVIYLTAHSDPATLSRAKLTGPFGYITKPFEIRDLATQVDLALYKHQAERQLREQREWLRVTLNSIGDAVIASDAGGRVTFLNPVAEWLTGWETGEAMGRPVSDVFRIVNETTGEPAEDVVARVLREGRAVPLGNHTALVTRDGRAVPVEDSAAPIKDGAGRVIGVVLVFHDVTEKRRAEEAQRASEERHRQLLGVMPAAMFTCDAEGRITYFNELAEKIWDRAPRLNDPEVRFSGATRLYRPDGTPLPHDQSPTASVVRHGIRVRGEEVLVERHDGSRLWVSVNIDPLRDEEGGISGAINVFTDISERKRTRQELSHQREMLQKIFDNIPVLLVMWDARLGKFLLNRHAEEVLGWTTADANDGDFLGKVYPDPGYRAEVEAYMRRLEPGWREWRAATRDGGRVPIEWASIRLSDDTTIGIGVDLRDRK